MRREQHDDAATDVDLYKPQLQREAVGLHKNYLRDEIDRANALESDDDDVACRDFVEENRRAVATPKTSPVKTPGKRGLARASPAATFDDAADDDDVDVEALLRARGPPRMLGAASPIRRPPMLRRGGDDDDGPPASPIKSKRYVYTPKSHATFRDEHYTRAKRVLNERTGISTPAPVRERRDSRDERRRAYFEAREEGERASAAGRRAISPYKLVAEAVTGRAGAKRDLRAPSAVSFGDDGA